LVWRIITRGFNPLDGESRYLDAQNHQSRPKPSQAAHQPLSLSTTFNGEAPCAAWAAHGEVSNKTATTSF